MEPVGLWEWFWIILLFAIPGVNLIAFIVCACGVGKQGVVNYCRACLMWFLVGLGLVLLLSKHCRLHLQCFDDSSII